ncbi:histidine--tRNA ligase [Staphylospora marina]|uniref:histidine--tRNA ligase n=1 Tax=Staphylospora marina TaxID=2490858 RepID=UPI000F5C0A4F|nr:histidine--tRNA ligase [Staphylospora marina]
MAYKIPRGTQDLLPGVSEKWQWVEAKFREWCRLYGYREVRTPVFEHTELFRRGVGETTDIVEKEMYSFQDRKGRDLTLRPEGTAGVVRAFVENKWYAEPQPTKWYYMGPMFRYERPQAGRNRQFHQFGVEAFGSVDPYLDAEVIALGMRFFREAGLRGVTVQLNSVGDPESRARYFEKLIEYFEPYKDELAEEARGRLYKNPMRILDSKDPRTKEISAGAPSILDFLSEEAKRHFDRVKDALTLLDIPFELNDRLVRGLDYYTFTAFEYTVESKGSQAGSIGGGGRYNRLVAEIGGPDMPGIGFGIGVERVLLALEEQGVGVPGDAAVDCWLVTLGEEADRAGVRILEDLRAAGLMAERDYMGRKLKAQFKQAERLGARFVAILGDEEWKNGQINVKNQTDGRQETISLDRLVEWLKEQV